MALPMMKAMLEGAAPHTRLPSSKIATNAMNTPLEWKWVYNFPEMGCSIADAS